MYIKQDHPTTVHDGHHQYEFHEHPRIPRSPSLYDLFPNQVNLIIVSGKIDSSGISIGRRLLLVCKDEEGIPSFQEKPWEDFGMMTTLPRPLSESADGIS